MTVSLVHVLLTTALLLAADATAAEIPSESLEQAAIRSLLEELESANNSGDVERWVGLFAADFVYMPPGLPPVTDRSELVELARGGFRNRAAISIEPSEIVVSGALAYALNGVTGSVKLHDSGEELKIDLKEIAILERGDDGTWRIARLIMNGNQ